MLTFCSFSLKGRSHREEPSRTGGSDEPSLQLLFIIINFLISITNLNTTKRPPSTSEKSCRKAASPAESPRFMSRHPKWCTLLCSVPHSLLPCRFFVSCFGGCSHQLNSYTKMRNISSLRRKPHLEIPLCEKRDQIAAGNSMRYVAVLKQEVIKTSWLLESWERTDTKGPAAGENFSPVSVLMKTPPFLSTGSSSTIRRLLT